MSLISNNNLDLYIFFKSTPDHIEKIGIEETKIVSGIPNTDEERFLTRHAKTIWLQNLFIDLGLYIGVLTQTNSISS